MPLINKNKISEEVFNEIIRIITFRKLKPGDKMPSENDLVKMLGVSRNTIRSALSKLNALGILEVHQGDGYFMRKVNIDIYVNQLIPILLNSSGDLETLTEFRIGVEGQAVFLASVRAEEDDLKSMEQCLGMMEQNLNNDEKFAEYDMEFHLAVAKASKNELCFKSFELIKTLYLVWLKEFVRNHGKAHSNEFHHQIFSAIKKRDPKLARELMMEHMTDVLDKVIVDKIKNKFEKTEPNHG